MSTEEAKAAQYLVTCSTARGGMRVSVHQGAWSKAINLENLGLHYNFHVLGPPQAVGRAEQLTGDVNESIMHFDCERTIAPRGFSPRKSTYASLYTETYCASYGIEFLPFHPSDSALLQARLYQDKQDFSVDSAGQGKGLSVRNTEERITHIRGRSGPDAILQV